MYFELKSNIFPGVSQKNYSNKRLSCNSGGGFDIFKQLIPFLVAFKGVINTISHCIVEEIRDAKKSLRKNEYFFKP